ncbi:hypothetical protein NDU88_011070 [Pleurodeles waltl]|uniref:Uncharacterized protein n=1 Tax=Pleurodeles waltl TaxID=8319 RepID=A0AAV7QZZ2_PLEWA|nr:hypothetical protein NDU88_011070 [Pleurodeles waltl]
MFVELGQYLWLMGIGFFVTALYRSEKCHLEGPRPTLQLSTRALEERKLLTVPMPGCHGDQSVLRRQLRGAGKREALILVIGINTTSINYGLVLLYYHILATSCQFWKPVARHQQM